MAGIPLKYRTTSATFLPGLATLQRSIKSGWKLLKMRSVAGKRTEKLGEQRGKAGKRRREESLGSRQASVGSGEANLGSGKEAPGVPLCSQRGGVCRSR